MLARCARLAAALLVVVASVVLLGSTPAHACKCVFGDVGRQVDRADAVFVGSFDRADRGVADGQISFVLTVDEVYRGRVSSTLTVRAPYSSATCGLAGIPAGEPVAWFVSSAPGEQVRSDLCTGTTPLTPQLARRLDRIAGPPGPPATSGPLVEAGGGIGAPGSRPPDEAGSSSPSDAAGSDAPPDAAGSDAPPDAAGSDAPTDAVGSQDTTGDRNEGTSGQLDGGLPWWAWTAIGVSIGAAGVAILRRRLGAHP